MISAYSFCATSSPKDAGACGGAERYAAVVAGRRALTDVGRTGVMPVNQIGRKAIALSSVPS